MLLELIVAEYANVAPEIQESQDDPEAKLVFETFFK
jgi:hypothetical protein